ncbi:MULTISPECIES: S26 family signal peptidase [Kordiimonas]|uniref:S26 family signal peptidase n=1 Tax=Kordiimonas TaxID=288021 RepID=UPI00257A41DA|nr:S26 family signal peptidase [Kordiimonas sp. UBA4487]
MLISPLLTLLLANATPADCTPVEKEIHGTSLEGQLMPGQKVTALPPGCRDMRRLDFVIFTSDESQNLVIKQIWGMPGDKLLVDDRGYVFVNDEQVLTPFDKPYRLNRYFMRKLKKFEGELTDYLLLGHPGSLDSGRVGPISINHIVGIVEKEEGRERH